jgi:hypothetical protein
VFAPTSVHTVSVVDETGVSQGLPFSCQYHFAAAFTDIAVAGKFYPNSKYYVSLCKEFILMA